MVLDFVAEEETSELLVEELGSIVSHHGVWYPESGENVPLNELPSSGSRDGG